MSRLAPTADPGHEGILRALQGLASALGLGPIRPAVIGNSSNLVVSLAPTPWVARVTTGTALMRAEGGAVLRELRVARHLAGAGAPVIAPAPEPLAGPHRLALPGPPLRASLWHRAELRAGTPEPRTAGRALAHCHRLLQELDADLPAPTATGGIGSAPPAASRPDTSWGAWAELQALLQQPAVRRAAPPAQHAWAVTQAEAWSDALRSLAEPAQWLHGDAHLNNVLLTDTGLVWTDWEDTQRAPLAWDAAGLLAAARVLGSHVDWSEAAFDAWQHRAGRPAAETLDLCIRARTLLVAVWTWALGPDDPARAPRLARRLAWLGAPGA